MFRLLIFTFMFSINLLANDIYFFNSQVDMKSAKIKVESYHLATFYFKNPNANKIAITVHGYLDNCSYMNYIHSQLWKKGYSILCIDLPGHGSSTGHQADITSFDVYGKIINKIPEKLLSQYETKYFIGHSTGAIVYHEYARELGDSPSLFNKVILITPLVRSANWLITSAGNYLLGSFIKEVERKKTNNEKMLHYFSKDPFYIKKIKTNWFNELKKWNEKILAKEIYSYEEINVFFAENDEIIDTTYNKEFYQKYFPSSKIQMLKDTSHRIQFDDENILFNFEKKFAKLLE